jgi:hypothetical protein
MTEYDPGIQSSLLSLQDVLDWFASRGGGGAAFTFRGAVPTWTDLPELLNTRGDTWWVIDIAHLAAWDNTGWVDLGPVAQGPPGRDGEDGSPGVGVPEGGSTEQVLTKASGEDFDTGWGAGGSVWVVLTQADYDALTPPGPDPGTLYIIVDEP